MDVVRHVRNNELTDLLGDKVVDGEGKPIKVGTLIKVVLRNIKAEQMEDLLTHGHEVAKALQESLASMVLTLRKEDHEWLMRQSKTTPWSNAMLRESFERAMQDFTEDVQAGEPIPMKKANVK